MLQDASCLKTRCLKTAAAYQGEVSSRNN